MHRGRLRMRHKIAREARRMHCCIHGKGNEKETSSKGGFDCAFLRKICNATGDSDGGRIMRTASNKHHNVAMHGLSEHVRWQTRRPRETLALSA